MALVLDGTNGVSGVDGTASSPAIEGTDSNTGIFYPAADTVAIGTGGTEALRVNSSQNVGIGTSSPATILNAYNATSAIISVDGDSTTNFRASRYSSDATASALTLRKGRGTLASPSAVNTSDTVGQFNFQAYGGSNFRGIVQIASVVETYTGDNDISGALTFSTRPTGVGAALTERMRLDSSGNVGIGTSSPDALLTVNTVASFGAGSAAAPSIAARGDLDTGMWFPAANAVAFSTGGTERARIDGAGDLYVGNANSTPGRIISRRNLTGGYDTAAIIVESASSSGNVGIALHNPGSNAPILRAERGAGNNIDSVNNLQSAFANFRAAAFTVVSDYRIKENVVPLTNALNRISHLKPSQFNFVEGSMMYNGGVTIDGFIAHEVSTVVPEAVIGNKDDVKEDGTPNYQSLDQAKLIPLLTAAIQELKAELDATKAEIAALKGNA